jgi:hypothetical protein
MKDIFLNKFYCEYIIISHDVDPEFITNEIGIIPSRKYSKGEIFRTKSSGTIGNRLHNLWAVKSETVVTDKEEISSHIQYFKSLFSINIDTLRKYKSNEYFEITFWVWIETENAGVSIDLSDSEISFINEISNGIHFSIITNNSFDNN